MFGEDFTHFTFRVEVLDPNGQPTDVGTTNLDFTINVKPVNDPPTIEAYWYPIWAEAGGENVCDEQTDTFPVVAFYRFKFRGRDIDNTCGEIRGQILNFLDPLVATAWVCGPQHQPDYTGPLEKGSFNCSDGFNLTTVEFIEPYEPAFFEVSIIPYPHWNGIIELDLVIWDPELFSYSANFKLRVRPINDLPSVVEGKTSVAVEYYERVGRDNYKQIEHDGESASFKVTEHESVEFRDSGGEVIQQAKGSVSAQTATTLETDNGLQAGDIVTVYRLRTSVQDRDFFFNYWLNMTGHVIHGQWVPTLSELHGNGPNKRDVEQNNACTFIGLYTVTCYEEVNVLNSWLINVGLALIIDDGADSAVGLFILNDEGSIDWLDRPLASGFTIEFYRPKDDDELVAPIAAIVILPVIAAATAAAIAAAWIALGQRAQDYAGASFDAFAVSTGQGGHSSPLYDAQGLEVTSALYANPHGGV
jgi:hypothetical protein